MAPTRHPLPLLCVGSCYIPLDAGGRQATTSSGGQKVVCAERNDSGPSTSGRKQGSTEPTQDAYLTVPLNFGLEMAATFPKSYRWLSEEVKLAPSSLSGEALSKATSSSENPLHDVTVYSLQDDVSVIQISDDHRHQPVEYQTCFTSRRHLEEAWAAGRSYLLAATLANRASIRQRVINAVHRKFARVAMHGIAFPFGEGPQDANRNEDEDGLLEPPEVQQLAAELGMHSGPESMSEMFGGGQPPPAIAQFGATLACGLISLLAPIGQAICGTMDGICGAVPVVDTLVLGDSAPPRKAPIQEYNMVNLLEAANEQNSNASAHALGKGLDKRLATSALWMGISIQLLLSQYISSAMASDASAVVLASGLPQNGKSGSASRVAGKHGMAGKPIVMDIFSGLVTSLQANDFVREAVTGEEGEREDSVSAIELEQLLRQNNGLEIGFKRKDLGPVKQLAPDATTVTGKGVILIGSLTDVQGNRVVRSMPPVGVVNAAKLLTRPEKTEAAVESPRTDDRVKDTEGNDDSEVNERS